MTLRRGIWLAAAIVVACLVLLGLAGNFLVDWAWFSSLGFAGVFWTVIFARFAVAGVVFVATAAILWMNGALAVRLGGPRYYPRPVPMPWDAHVSDQLPAMIDRFIRQLPWRRMVAVVALVLALLVALGWSGNWSLVLNYLFQADYGKSDPVFHQDFGFYLFTLPCFVAVKNWLLLVLVLCAITAAVIYRASGAISFQLRRRVISPAAGMHGSALLAAFFAIEAWSFWLDRYLLLYGDNGVVVGASYTDVNVRLPILVLLIVLSCAAALACLVNIRLRTVRIPVMSAAVVLGISLFLMPLAAALFSRVFVKPNELKLEEPYIAANIDLTREAYKLGNVVVKPFTADQTLTAQSLADNRATIDNIRLWDRDPLLDTYSQLQEIRTYYKFNDADIDRYVLGNYQQVMVSARELESSLLPANAQTWVNLHLLFTHGNGLVMSPVTRTTPEGLPDFYLRDIPPVATGGPPITEPRIYFGEGTAPYAIVGTTTQEFDYPKGSENVYRSYDGSDGVAIGGLARRALFAWYFGDLNILLSGYLTPESRILIRRNIQQRVSAIAPFLVLDHDPYAIVSGGRIYWMQDAYTTSSWFPYAPSMEGGDANYIRNSVKIVIDAYNGSVDFYVSDPADPLIETWRRIFPVLFKPFAAMPAGLKVHIRYPEDLFLVQAQLYRAYHMGAPEVFYNREDLWQFPSQPNGIDEQEGTSRMAPYYINIRLPGETRTEFILMLPMVPSQRENMIAWLAARCDPTDYGRLIVYEFPKEKLVYGPFQIEALINQNTEISQQITLWNQSGSRVIRGNLLVVPIENSLLYVTPLYLRAQTGQLPELKRVIAIYGDKVVMEQTLAGALAALFNAPVPAPAAPAKTAAAVSTTAPAVGTPPSAGARAALDHYDRAMADLKAGNWSGFGAELDALRTSLQQLNQAAPGH